MNNSIDDIRTRKLIVSNTFFKAGTLIAQIFLNVYLFKETNDIQLIAIFNALLYASLFLGFAVFGRFIKSGYRRRTLIASLVGLVFVYIAIIVSGKTVIYYYPIFAILLGFFRGMYWITYNNNEFDLTHKNNRGNVAGLKRVLKSLVGLFVPSIAGVIIAKDYLGFGNETAFALGVVFFIATAVLGTVRVNKTTAEKYNLLAAIKKVWANKNLRNININNTLLGFSMSNPLIETILPLILVSYGVNEMELGLFFSAFTFFSVACAYILGKFISYRKYKTVYIISVAFYVFSVIILLFFQTYWYVVFFNAILNLVFTLVLIPQGVFSANIFQDMKGYKDIEAEYMVIREGFLNVGRVLSFVCLYFIGSFDVIGLQILFFILAIIMVFSGYLFSQLDIGVEE